MLVIGEKEAESNAVSIRKHGEGDIGQMSVSEFLDFFDKSVEESMNLN